MGKSLDTPSRQAEAEAVLRRYWKYPSFRTGQWEVIEGCLKGEDGLAVLPTGGGKSVCYQVPALMLDGLTLVVSPLIALMQDQVAGLNARNISATYINSTVPHRVIEQRLTDAEFGQYKLLYVAPERLQSELFLARIERIKVALIAVDEAHCISEWGLHFRPSYLDIAKVRQPLKNPPILAVTATATPEVRKDILEALELRDPRILVKGFDRPNLTWSIFRTENKQADVKRVVGSVKGSGLIYAATRNRVEQWADWLNRQGMKAEFYHAGLKADTRKKVQTRWISGETRIVVATNAFGMGIDKADVRFIIHVDLPGSVEAYYQEAGRGGRDGKRSHAVLLYQEQDEDIYAGLVKEGHPDAKSVQEVYSAVCNLAQVPIGDEPDGSVPIDLEAVAGLTGFSVIRVASAIELLVRQEIWEPAPSHKHKGEIRFLQSADAVRHYLSNLSNSSLVKFVETLQRTVHAEAFSGWWSLDLPMLERRLSMSRERLLRGLEFLVQQKLIAWQPPGATQRVRFLEPRTQRVRVDIGLVRKARRRAEVRQTYMRRYARSVSCRRQFLLAYFGERHPGNCGACDLCLGRHEAVVVTSEEEPILRHMLEQIAAGRTRETWFEETTRFDPKKLSPHRIAGLVDWLIQEGYIEMPEPLVGTLALTTKARDWLEQWAPRK